MLLKKLKDNISNLPGVGPSAKKSYAALGVTTFEDLLLLSPRTYDDRSRIVPVNEIGKEGHVNTFVEVISKDFFGGGAKRTLKITVRDISEDGHGRLSLVCFGRNFMDKTVFIGSRFYINAACTRFGSELQSTQFNLAPMEGNGPEKAGFGRILPIYPLAQNLSQRIVRRDVEAVLARVPHFDNELPDYIYSRYSLMSTDEAIRAFHFPAEMKDAERARRTLAFTELFYLCLSSRKLGNRINTRKAEPGVIYPAEQKLISSLPFSLTNSQEKALSEIRADLDSGVSMNRLLQGDVGSGKTLVAWLSAVHEISKGYQVAFMAPTEILARQHEINAREILSPLGIRIAALTGSTDTKTKKDVLRRLSDGAIDLIIGTHALFSEGVEYRNLGYAIIDEQHRFGVKQRKALLSKAEDPHVLSMTATPIPRTLALTLYGDINVSELSEMPPGRLPVVTYLVDEKRREAMYSSIGVEFTRGHRAYFVYPRIEGDESAEKTLRDVTTMFEFLKTRYPGVPSALLHSRLSEDEKIAALEKFRRGELSYLVATSVVEVGLDVPTATCMVIEHAERFGLAALHQLRGRVGRSSLQSWCFLVYSDEITENGKARLRAMKETTDGFVIAERDLALRGPGEILGVRQSGFARLRFADTEKDSDLLRSVREEVNSMEAEKYPIIRMMEEAE